VLGFPLILLKGQRRSRGLNWGAFCGLRPKRRFRVLGVLGVSVVFLRFWRGGVKMSQSLDEQSTRLYRIRKTIMEMLRDRDYVVAEFELSFTKDQFREKYGDEPKREDLVIQKPRRSNNAEHVGFLACISLALREVLV
jgi:hypothetical protein